MKPSRRRRPVASRAPSATQVRAGRRSKGATSAGVPGRPVTRPHGGPARKTLPPAPRWRRRKEARPAELLDAALEVFVERGYTATRLEDIAQRAGVTKGTMYLYYENKEALFKELVRTTALPMVEEVEALVRTHRGSSRELVTLILRRRWEALVRSNLGGIAKLMMSEAGNFPELGRWYHDEIISRANAALARAIRLGVERGEFRPVDERLTAYVAVAPLLIAAMWMHSFALCTQLPFAQDEYLDHHLDIFMRGLEPEAKGHA